MLKGGVFIEMNALDVRESIDAALPDDEILADVSNIVTETGGSIELDGRVVNVPSVAKVTIITKAFFKEYFDIGFWPLPRSVCHRGGEE